MLSAELRASIRFLLIVAALAALAVLFSGCGILDPDPTKSKRWMQVCVITWSPPPGYYCEMRRCDVWSDGRLPDCANKPTRPCAWNEEDGLTCPAGNEEAIAGGSDDA